MISVVGGAGFIGLTLIEGLDQRGREGTLVVVHLRNGCKMHKLTVLYVGDYLDREDTGAQIQANQDFRLVEAIFHQWTVRPRPAVQ